MILQGWSDLLAPWIDFDKNIVMDKLDYVLRLTKMIQNSTKAIDMIITVINIINGPKDDSVNTITNVLDIIGDLGLIDIPSLG